MAPVRRPRPIKGRNPGYSAGKKPPKSGPKKPWSRAEEIGKRVADSIGSLNPFD